MGRAPVSVNVPLLRLSLPTLSVHLPPFFDILTLCLPVAASIRARAPIGRADSCPTGMQLNGLFTPYQLTTTVAQLQLPLLLRANQHVAPRRPAAATSRRLAHLYNHNTCTGSSCTCTFVNPLSGSVLLPSIQYDIAVQSSQSILLLCSLSRAARFSAEMSCPCIALRC